MEKAYILIFVIILYSCNTQETERTDRSDKIKSETTANFNWLLGDWKRTNDSEGKQTFESWKKISDKVYAGFSFTKEMNDTVWYENINLINRDTVWNFEVTGKNDSNPVIFQLSNIDSNAFVSENPIHDFPKKISYSLINDTIKAIISDEENMILFDFVKF